jgi:hypothetical protein
MDGMAGPGSRALAYPALAFAFALILSGYAVWDTGQLSGRRYSLPDRDGHHHDVHAAHHDLTPTVPGGSPYVIEVPVTAPGYP